MRNTLQIITVKLWNFVIFKKELCHKFFESFETHIVHLFQTKIGKTNLLQKRNRKFMKIFLQRRATFPLHVLFIEISYK